jgi:hypothetical protein
VRKPRFGIDAIAFYAFLLLIFSLAFWRPFLLVNDHVLPPSDLIYVLTAVLTLIALLSRRFSFRWSRFNWLLIVYFLAMAASSIGGENAAGNVTKLVGQVYLLSIPVLAIIVLDDAKKFRIAVYVWLAATLICSIIGDVSVLVYFFDRSNWLLSYTLSKFGSLPPGNYPRIQSTFLNMNLLCNYVSVGLGLLVIAAKLGWVSKKAAVWMFTLIGICAVFTISPGLGGICLFTSVWFWRTMRDHRPILARLSLSAGIAAAALFLIVSSIAPNHYPTAPFSVTVPIIERRIEPSSRALTWMGAFKTFTEEPLFGKGVGADATAARYLDASGYEQYLTDAHNTFLNVAALEGLFGLTAIILITIYFVRRLFPIDLGSNNSTVRAALALTFVNAFVYQGLTGSYEDARHLWILMGMILAAERIQFSGSPLKTPG